MLMFWKENLVLLAVPKTATTALSATLAPRAAMVLQEPPTLKHTPLYRYRRFVEPYLAAAGIPAPETLAVVRHPVDWLGSWYRYRRRDDLKGHPNSTSEVTFDAFVRAWCQGRPPPFAAVGSQVKFLTDREGGPGITHLFRYEDQAGLIGFLEERLGMRIDLPQRNVSPPGDLTLTEETEKRLRQKRAEEFVIWESAGRNS